MTRRRYVEPDPDGNAAPALPLPPTVARKAAQDRVWAEIAGEAESPPAPPMNRERRRRAERVVKRSVRKLRGQVVDDYRRKNLG